jgi:hypothetical protein
MHIQSTDRAAFKIREFAAKFGHHPAWAYRQVYAGNVAVIDVMGQLMVPAGEVDRLLALAKPYDPKPRKAKPEKREAGKRRDLSA